MKNKVFARAIEKQIKDKGQIIELKTTTKEETESNSIYNDEKGDTKKESYYLKGYIHFNPDEKLVTKMGVNKEDVNVVVRTTTRQLKNRGLIGTNNKVRITVDDKLIINGEEYDIVKVTPIGHFNSFITYGFAGLRK